MGLWESFGKRFRAADKRYLTPYFARSQVDVPRYDDTEIAEGEAYCRIWLVEMRLAHGVEWFKTRYPAVYAATRYDYGGKPVTVPYVGGLEFFRNLAEKHLDRVIQLNRPLTPLFPFNRGVVDLQAGLFSVQASDPIGRFLGAMGRLANLVPVPELSSVLNLVDPLYQSIEDLLDAGQSNLELGYQQAFVAAGRGGGFPLRAGYFAAILAQENEIEVTHLRVGRDGLRIQADGVGGGTLPLPGFSYMLFWLERAPQQDWESLANIRELVERAQNAIELKQPPAARDLLSAIKVAIARSPDVAKADRTGMFNRIEAHLKELGLQGTPAGGARPSLYAIMQRPAPPGDAENSAEMVWLAERFGLGS